MTAGQDGKVEGEQWITFSCYYQSLVAWAPWHCSPSLTSLIRFLSCNHTTETVSRPRRAMVCDKLKSDETLSFLIQYLKVNEG